MQKTRLIERRKTISITEDTHDQLNRMGLRGETFDDIIRKCIQAYNREQSKQKK
ncbi:MAG: hypothetical protein ACR2IS_14790 [Nitrososphaeraceae archaeon]